MTPQEAVKEYQCPGCVSGPALTCFVKDKNPAHINHACEKHHPGTIVSGIGLIFLGLPTGFCRLGPAEKTMLSIFEKPEDGWIYDESVYNIPAWKHLDTHGNTIVRGMSPRINYPWIHIFLGDHIDKINCVEITNRDLEGMD